MSEGARERDAGDVVLAALGEREVLADVEPAPGHAGEIGGDRRRSRCPRSLSTYGVRARMLKLATVVALAAACSSAPPDAAPSPPDAAPAPPDAAPAPPDAAPAPPDPAPAPPDAAPPTEPSCVVGALVGHDEVLALMTYSCEAGRLADIELVVSFDRARFFGYLSQIVLCGGSFGHTFLFPAPADRDRTLILEASLVDPVSGRAVTCTYTPVSIR